MKNQILYASLFVLLTACSSKTDKYDATGTFDAVQTTVFAEQGGKLLDFSISEGDVIEKDMQVGLIDTMSLYLTVMQLKSQRQVFLSGRPDIEKQLAAVREQLNKALLEQKRQHDLYADGATAAKTVDDADNQVRVLQKQLESQTSVLNTQIASLNAQAQAAEAQMDVVSEQLRKCRIMNPITGTVLEKYVERSEYVSMGKPLYKIADIGNMRLKAYLTSSQLEKVKIGQQVSVYADFGGGQKREYAGVVSWISERSEFTPKTILTDDERADLVYQVKIDIKNDGFVKIGMYGEVKL